MRKEWTQCSISINDGRYKEQKARLLANYPLSQIIYLIEGDLSELYSSTHRKAVSGSIFNMQFRDKIRVVRTKDLNDTCEFILSLYSKSTKNPEWFITGESQPQSENDSVDYSSLIKVNKSGNMTPQVCQIVMLTHIPGVSHNFLIFSSYFLIFPHFCLIFPHSSSFFLRRSSFAPHSCLTAFCSFLPHFLSHARFASL